MKDGDSVRSKDNRQVGKFVRVDAYTGYIEGHGWRTPECTIKDISQYWKVVGSNGNYKITLPFD